MATTPGKDALVEIEIDDIAHGGEGVGRVSGKAHFVPGVIPGERVVGRITKDAGAWARAELVEVRAAATDRVRPRCPYAGNCGGCQWQHAGYEAQLAWKRNTVVSQLAHIGKISDPPVAEIVAPGPPFGYRNRMDFRVRDGRPALHRARSHELIALESCDLLDPGLAEIFSRLGDLSAVDRLTLRIGTNTGDSIAIVSGPVPPQAVEWGTAVARQVGKEVTPVDGPAHITEVVGELRFRISGSTFFQNNTHGASALVELVTTALEPTADDTVLDAYAGVGLFGAALAASSGRVIAVESDRGATADLRRNLAATGVEHRVIRGKMERVAGDLDEYPQLVVADPPRSGLGEAGVAAAIAAAPRRLAYVSCDPASLARDAATLATLGYELLEVVPVDMFPQTYHIEAVATFAAV